jgi:hypothetical protein
MAQNLGKEERRRTDSCRCDVKITGPYHRFLLVEVADVGFKMKIPHFLRIHGLSQDVITRKGGILGRRTDLQILPSVDNVGPDDIVILKFKGDDSAFYGARIWMTRQCLIDTERFEFR